MDLLRRGTTVPLLLLSVWALWGCSSSPTASTATTVDLTSPAGMPPPADAGSLETGTVLGFVSAETSTPAAGASIRIGTTQYVTDAAGEVRLSEFVTLPAAVEATSGPYLTRETVIRSRDERRLTLWPRHSPTGLDEELTRRL